MRTEELDSTNKTASRPFRWRGVWILSALFVAGNLLSTPQLVQQGNPVPAIPLWAAFTALNFVVVATGQFFANRVDLGAPLVECRLTSQEVLGHSRNVIIFAVLLGVLASPLVLMYNRYLATGTVSPPQLWRLILASVDAGIQEEIFNRFFVMSLFVWIGWRLQGAQRGAPKPTVYWMAILLSASLFAWDHVEGHIANLSPNRIAEVLVFTGGLGIGFGWCYWKLGLECAILAHILVDAVGMVLVNAVYFPANSFVLPITIIGLLVVGVTSYRLLIRPT